MCKISLDNDLITNEFDFESKLKHIDNNSKVKQQEMNKLINVPNRNLNFNLISLKIFNCHGYLACFRT